MVIVSLHGISPQKLKIVPRKINLHNCLLNYYIATQINLSDHSGPDCMVVGFTVQSVPMTTKVVSSNPTYCEVYLLQLYVIMFVSDLWQVSGFLRVLRFPPPIKLITI